ncbi:hypothetical protein AYI69_g3404 [Smittium culicis]|uniref:Uncharacterized protein n=1 Tax=Smittium culicis TaxID=133412 RepID=A0A1R1YJS3_9FUNG|nr:hypothetical protein AYI69_g3404 [Smittium culicis]
MFDEEILASTKSNTDGFAAAENHPMRSRIKINPEARRTLTEELVSLLFKNVIEEVRGEHSEVCNTKTRRIYSKLLEHRAKEHCTNYTEILDGYSYSDRTCNPESKILEGATKQMEYTVIPSRNSEAGDIYRLQIQFIGGGSWVKTSFSDMVYTGGIDAHQYQRATDDIICATSQEASGNRGTDLETLPINQQSPPDNLRTVSIEPGRCPELSNSAKKMVNIRPNIHETERYVRPRRHGFFCFQQEQEAEAYYSWFPEISDKVPRPDGIINIPIASASGDNNNSRSQKRGVPSKSKVCQILSLTLSFQTNDVSNVNPGTIMSNNAF